MICPLKFSRYEFEGGETCIGSECGFYGGVCDMDSGEYVQKRPNDELQEGDAVSILRRAADSDTPMVSLCDRFDTAPLLPSEHSRVFGRLADMVERDYARRDAVNAEIAKLIAERDDLQRKLEILKAHGVEIVDAVAGGFEVYNEAVRERDEWKAKAEAKSAKDDAHSKAQSKTEPNLTEQSEPLSDESDSREKLEAELHNILHCAQITIVAKAKNKPFDWHTVDGYIPMICELFDRQVAITERECCKYIDGAGCDGLEVVHRLNERIVELTAELEAAHAKNRALKLHISKMQQGRHGWHVKGVELQRQVDELTAQLRASNAERARLRECLGIATDNAHDFLNLVDESGNVYDCDEGLA